MLKMCEEIHTIKINNVENFSKLCYPVILLKGEIISNAQSITNIITFKIKSIQSTYETTSVICNNKFKHLLELNKGVNYIKIQYCCTNDNLTLYYKPIETNFCAVPVYIICKNHDGTFDSPIDKDNSINTACKKIVIGIRLIQCLLSEKFATNGLSRKTFQLESDVYSNVPKCRIFYSNLDVNNVRNMTQDELWYAFGRELMTSDFANDQFKYLAFIACTRYRGDKYQENMSTYTELVTITEAHAALGGGGLAIFGSACLHTWPTDLQDVVKHFEDETIVDKKQFMDDSCYRGTFSGCFATTLGSVCHELCHTFDLGHTFEGIMGRGFDEINQEFTLISVKLKSKVYKTLTYEQQHSIVAFIPNAGVSISKDIRCLESKKSKDRLTVFKKNECNDVNGIQFTRSCLLLLYYHRWFNAINEAQHSIKYENDVITSTAGICVLEVREEISGFVLKWWDFCSKPVNKFDINVNKIRQKFNNESLLIIAEDIVGNILKHKL